MNYNNSNVVSVNGDVPEKFAEKEVTKELPSQLQQYSYSSSLSLISS